MIKYSREDPIIVKDENGNDKKIHQCHQKKENSWDLSIQNSPLIVKDG